MTIMNNAPSKVWPDDYLHWTGSFEDMLSQASEILATLAPGLEPPTASLARYYQQQNLLGRGTRKGRSSIFSFDDLATLVATKQMAKHLQSPLSVARHVFSNSPAATVSMSAYGVAGNHEKNEAEKLVGKLLAQSYPAPAAPVHMGSLQGQPLLSTTHPTSFSATQSSALPVAPFPAGGVLRYTLGAGVVVEIETTANDRTAQANALRDFANQLSPQPPHKGISP